MHCSVVDSHWAYIPKDCFAQNFESTQRFLLLLRLLTEQNLMLGTKTFSSGGSILVHKNSDLCNSYAMPIAET